MTLSTVVRSGGQPSLCLVAGLVQSSYLGVAEMNNNSAIFQNFQCMVAIILELDLALLVEKVVKR